MRVIVSLGALALALVVGSACSSDDDGSSTNPIPGEACDASKPLVCGSLSAGSNQNQVILFCKNGKYESVGDCKPTGNGLTNRCFEGANFTVVDCFDEPSVGQVTRCEVKATGAETSAVCSVGSR
jgi:hypothetical protein